MSLNRKHYRACVRAQRRHDRLAAIANQEVALIDSRARIRYEPRRKTGDSSWLKCSHMVICRMQMSGKTKAKQWKIDFASDCSGDEENFRLQLREAFQKAVDWAAGT